MRGLEILRILSGDSIILDFFGGVYARDQLIFKLPNREIFYICNIDDSNNEGKHWVVIYYPKNGYNIEYFDSLGKKPIISFVNFMSKSKRFILYNTKRFQGSNSSVCGYFCLYFVYFRCRGVVKYRGLSLWRGCMIYGSRLIEHYCMLQYGLSPATADHSKRWSAK